MDVAIEHKINAFFAKYRDRKIVKGQYVIFANEEPSGIFYVANGEVTQNTISASGELLVINTFKTGAVFPLDWAINSSLNSYFYISFTDTTLYIAPKIDVSSFLRNNADVVYYLLQKLQSDNDGKIDRIVHLMGSTALVRSIHELIFECTSLDTKLVNKYQLALNESEFASRIGITRETANKALKILKQRGLIAINPQGIYINNLLKLEQELKSFI